MPPLLELQRDKLLRLRLILVCLAVALFVSTIYVVVSYRLSSQLGIDSEAVSLHRQAMLFHAELVEADNEATQRLQHLIELTYLNDHVRTELLYVEAHGDELDWSLNHNMTFSQITIIKEKIHTKVSQNKPSSPMSMVNGLEKIDGKRFLWQVVEGLDYKIVMIEAASSVDTALDLIAKRLSLTSFIVFWMAVWLAITLSSWMAKRVQSKNDALERLATYDSLTGLPNRLYLINMMQNIMPETPSEYEKTNETLLETPTRGCLFVIDLDKFKEVNDTFGHSSGDVLLRAVSQKLALALNPTQTVMRIGGDEFIIWAPDLEIEEAHKLAQKLIDVCNEPIMIHKLSINTGASIGLAYYPSHAKDAESLMVCADIAMYEAKQKRSGWSIFSERNTQLGHQRLRLRADLESALSERQIKFHYQPKVELNSGDIIGVEALARWYHPTDGILAPVHFIDLIEQSGRIQEFGRYVIQSAIQQLALWKTQGLSTPIAINLSPYNLLDPDLLEFTLALLKQYSIDTKQLEIELIESSTSINIDYIASRLDDFKQAGITLAIDDFGTGMSSLSYISNIKVNNIKIDRSFICDIEDGANKKAIVCAAITLATSFNCNAIAEGIETKTQADTLIKMGCLYGQGYYYAKPMPTDEIEALLLSYASLPI
ncbi:EAL domain-containing protein [Marinomonas sp. RSW2]|uniref:EAL domain-containing protein n=1 Tax=Marinomonas maritima TaxID=2940935 RepID=A0ABT5WA94_9GAMM|nr:EAL domain-containing protein [Marinomonas maritima]MDE8601750.1 EAL domain-containing protein [Marinomonas maritima]